MNSIQLNPAQQAVWEAVQSSDSLVLSMPTGTGKTMMAEDILTRQLNSHPETTAWYVSPFRALSEEKLGKWRGDPVLCRVECLTIEKAYCHALEASPPFDSIGYTSPEAFKGISAVVVDEAHFLWDSERGGKLLVALLALSRLLPDTCRLVLMTAAENRAKSLHEWLGAFWKTPVRLATSDWAPPAKLIFMPNGSLDTCVRMAASKTYNGGKVILFVPSIKLQSIFHSALNRDTVQSAIYNSTMSAGARHEALRKFEAKGEDSTEVLISTSALSAGVNTGANTVLIFGSTWTEDEIEQMAGRARGDMRLIAGEQVDDAVVPECVVFGSSRSLDIDDKFDLLDWFLEEWKGACGLFVDAFGAFPVPKNFTNGTFFKESKFNLYSIEYVKSIPYIRWTGDEFRRSLEKSKADLPKYAAALHTFTDWNDAKRIIDWASEFTDEVFDVKGMNVPVSKMSKKQKAVLSVILGHLIPSELADFDGDCEEWDALSYEFNLQFDDADIELPDESYKMMLTYAHLTGSLRVFAGKQLRNVMNEYLPRAILFCRLAGLIPLEQDM